jgi:hypothetical protein
VRDPISKKKKKSQNRAGVVAQGISPEFKPWYRKKKKKSCLFGKVFTSSLISEGFTVSFLEHLNFN